MRTFVPASLGMLLSLIAIAAGAPAHAQVPCGTTLYGAVTLTADVVCGAGMDGLVIGDHKVRIELNGYGIIGPYTFANPAPAATGVRSSGFESVQIVGPGRITGFHRPVDIDGGNNHLISGVEALAESGLPVTLRNGSGSVVEMSRMTAVEVASDPGLRATANRIVDNDIGPDPGLPGGGITLRGCDTADNVVAYNRIDPRTRRAVILDEGANANQVLKNKIVMGEIFLDGASNNMIAGNTFKNDGFSYSGVQIESSYTPVACAGGALLPGSKNIVRDNRVRGGAFGVLLDDTWYAGLCSANLVTGNSFTDQLNSGLIFGYGAIDNDARGNVYLNVSPLVYDFGMGNLWP